MTYDPHNIDLLNRIKPAYLAAYGLIEAPFSSQHDDRFLYLNPALTERLELLKHYTQYGNLLLIISGERGIGKSSLKQRFINTAQEEWQICEIQSHTMMDASLLLKQIANGFGINQPPASPSMLFEILSEQLEQFHKLSCIPILLVDDAHELPQEALQSLLYLAEPHPDQQTALRIILFCEPQIETMLEDPAIQSLKERVTHSMQIAPLDETETAEYLRHRLAVAGLDGTSPFTPKLIHKIFKASAGIPSKINEYAHQNLLDDKEPFINEETNLDDELIHRASYYNFKNRILGGIALVVIITVLLFQDNINQIFEETDIVIADNNIKIEQHNSTPPEVIATPVKKEKTIEFSLQKDLPLDDKKNEDKEPNANKEPPINKNQNSSDKPIVLKLSTVNPNPVPASKQRQIISIIGTGFHKRQKVKVRWTGKEKILDATQVNVTSENFLNLILNVGMQTDTWHVTIIDPVLNIESNTVRFEVVAAEPAKAKETPAKLSTPKLNVALHNGLYGQNWIKLQNKDHFTLQLLGTHNKDTLPRYLKKYSLKEDAATFKTKRKNKDWYTLVYGHYPTKAAAQNAAKQLPKGVNKPWLRTFSSILPSLTKDTSTSQIIIPMKPIPDNQEGWLWSQDPRHYTLQLAAGPDKKAILRFIKRHHLKSKAVYFHQVRDGKDWYVLVHGSYSGVSKAKLAIRQLPLAVQKTNPWVRNFSAIHAELN